MDWFEEKEMDNVTLEEFERLCDEVFELRGVIDEKEADVKAHRQKLEVLQSKVLSYMEKFDKKKHTGRLGTLSLRIESYPAMPKDPGKKQAFFDYLKEKDVFDEMITVNSQRLRGFFKSEKEAAGGDENPDFSIPGLEPFERKSITMRKSK